ncbi:MAG: T9SS type A sorting domain-containing protein [Saprospiraceae bacterium]
MKKIKQKLQQYQNLNQGFKKNRRKKNTALNVGKSILAVALPVLSFGTADAQCQGSQANSVTLPQGGGILIDVDGDAVNDFSIKDGPAGAYQASFLALPLGTARILTSGGSGTVKNYGGVINGAAGVGTSAGYHWFNFNSGGNITGGNWGAPYPKSGYMGVKKAGKLGFIQLTIHSGPTAQADGGTIPYKISISEAGLSPNVGGTVTAGSCPTLPVELIDFKANIKHNNVQLTWTTASEENNAGFEVQRSTDGKNYETLVFKEGAGSTVIEHNYFCDDENLRKGQVYYYRLKQVDFNGQFIYTKVVTAALKNESVVINNFYPNPTNGVTQLEYETTVDTELSAIVYNVSGQELIRNVQMITAGTNNLSFDFSSLSIGIYFVKLQAGEDIQYQKLIIQ